MLPGAYRSCPTHATKVPCPLPALASDAQRSSKTRAMVTPALSPAVQAGWGHSGHQNEGDRASRYSLDRRPESALGRFFLHREGRTCHTLQRGSVASCPAPPVSRLWLARGRGSPQWEQFQLLSPTWLGCRLLPTGRGAWQDKCLDLVWG